MAPPVTNSSPLPCTLALPDPSAPRSQFFAYYGLLANNDSLISLAHEQIRLYRANLQDPRTKLWRHIYVPGGSDSHSDPGLWATGECSCVRAT